MKILAVGDIVGDIGLNKLKELLPSIIEKENIDFVIVKRREHIRWNGNYNKRF